ncbi:MAG: hypothetical protein V4692_15955 [Bdellovibrionota bacterium]
MKTVSFRGSNMTRVLFVLGALGAFYFYRRRGGSVSAIANRGMDAVKSAREMITKAAPSIGAQASKVESAAQTSSAGLTH